MFSVFKIHSECWLTSSTSSEFRYSFSSNNIYGRKIQLIIKNINLISNGNRTVWSPNKIRSVIIWVINKIRRPRSRSPICLITSMITDWIGWHEVLLPINHNFNKICDIIGYFLNQNTRNSKFCFASSEKKNHLSARMMARTVQLLRHDAYCPIKLSN